mmetsp:Transcript_16808/g.34149  ORF Transcript_16808/g.34149 Transcript_16808/m.34149 type:complete len:93 (-) Transcript_16808:164-442(-)
MHGCMNELESLFNKRGTSIDRKKVFTVWATICQMKRGRNTATDRTIDSLPVCALADSIFLDLSSFLFGLHASVPWALPERYPPAVSCMQIGL